MERIAIQDRSRLRSHFWLGAALLALGHILIFARTPGGGFLRPLSDYWFAFIWFGYIVALDALIFQRDGRSLIASNRRVFLAMLPLSAAMWWGFEWVNAVVQNWHYLSPPDIHDWYASIWSCIFFSTVIPAVWETATWLSGTRLLRNLPGTPGVPMPGPVPYVFIFLGVASFALAFIWPDVFFALIWGFLAMILDPLNYLQGRPSMLGYIRRGQWRVPVAFYLGGLVCGVLWEFWNYWAFPKWFYTIPHVGFWKVFEMPLLGYLGYGPFAWELFALFFFVAGLVPGFSSRAGVELLDTQGKTEVAQPLNG